MLYKSFVLTITLLLCSIGNAIAAETSTGPDLDREQQLRTTAFANTSAPVGETLDSLPIDVPTQVAVNPDVLPAQADPLVAKAVERRDPESLLLPMDIEQAWSLDMDAAPVAGVKLQAIAPRDGVVEPIAGAELSPGLVAGTFDPAQYLDLGYYSPANSLLDGRIAQAPETAPAPPLRPDRPVGDAPTTTSVEPVKPVNSAVQPEPSKWAYSVHTQLSTTGFIGADVGYKFNPNLHARLGVNAIGFGTNYGSQGIDYNANFNPTNIHLLGDYFPFGGGLRLTGGLVLQNNGISATGKPNGAGQVVINNNPYNATDLGTLEAEGSFSNSVAPYLGIGFGTPISPGLGFNIDAGVMFAGSPTVKLRANNISPLVPIATQNQIRQDLAAQEQRTNNDIGGFSVFPVISIGVSYTF
jgi:hypothetical protein